MRRAIGRHACHLYTIFNDPKCLSCVRHIIRLIELGRLGIKSLSQFPGINAWSAMATYTHFVIMPESLYKHSSIVHRWHLNIFQSLVDGMMLGGANNPFCDCIMRC